MVPRAGLEPARIAPHAPQTCAATNYATSAIPFWIADFGMWIKRLDPQQTVPKPQTTKNYLFTGASVFAGAGMFAFAGSVFAGAAAVFASASGAVTLTFVSPAFAGASAGISSALCKTETPPLRAGIEIISADTINTVAATIVILDSTEAVPRGPKAALDTLLVNSAPASVLPGWSSTEPTSTMHDMKNNAYKTYNKFLNHL